MTFIAYKPSRRFTAQITFQSVRCLQGISCPLVCSVLYSRGVNRKEVILRILFFLESFQMIANGERNITGFTLFTKKKSRFVEEVLFQPKNEVVAVPKVEIK